MTKPGLFLALLFILYIYILLVIYYIYYYILINILYIYIKDLIITEEVHSVKNYLISS